MCLDSRFQRGYDILSAFTPPSLVSNFISLYGWLIMHWLYTLYFLYAFICLLGPTLILYLRDCEGNNKHGHASVCWFHFISPFFLLSFSFSFIFCVWYWGSKIGRWLCSQPFKNFNGEMTGSHFLRLGSHLWTSCLPALLRALRLQMSPTHPAFPLMYMQEGDSENMWK